MGRLSRAWVKMPGFSVSKDLPVPLGVGIAAFFLAWTRNATPATIAPDVMIAVVAGVVAVLLYRAGQFVYYVFRADT